MMTIMFDEVFRTMAIIPDTMPWRLFIDMDDVDCKRDNEDFGLRLILEYGTTRHYLLDSDSIRSGAFYGTVELEDVKDCFESIIHEACLSVNDPESKFFSLYHIIARELEQYARIWCDEYKLPNK